MHSIVVSFLGLVLGFNVVEALTIGSPLAITQQLGESLQNVSLESAAEAQYNSKDFALSPPESIPLTSGSVSAANSSAESLNTTLGTYVKCDGDALGFGLSPASCYRMLSNPMMGMHDRTQRTWGERGSGAQVILPLRYVSLDGTCIIEPIIPPGSTSAIGRASSAELALGAGAIIHGCVDKPNSQGGLGKDFSRGGTLGVFVAKQEPNVRCYGDAQVQGIVNSCYLMFETMPIDNNARSFGVGGSVPLPWTQRAPDGRCYMTLRSTGPVDYASWLRIWANAVTVANMCLAQGKKGVWSGIGSSGRLYLELGRQYPADNAAMDLVSIATTS